VCGCAPVLMPSSPSAPETRAPRTFHTVPATFGRTSPQGVFCSRNFLLVGIGLDASWREPLLIPPPGQSVAERVGDAFGNHHKEVTAGENSMETRAPPAQTGAHNRDESTRKLSRPRLLLGVHPVIYRGFYHGPTRPRQNASAWRRTTPSNVHSVAVWRLQDLCWRIPPT